MKGKKYAHRVIHGDAFEFNKRIGKQPELPITSGELSVRVIDLPKGTVLKSHGHSKRMDKFLLKGKLIYENDQEILAGSWAKLLPRKQYDVQAVEDSHLLLIERVGSMFVSNDKKVDSIGFFFEKLSVWFRKSKSTFSDYFFPASIFAILVAPSIYLLVQFWPATDAEIRALYNSISINLMAALIFLFIVNWAKNSYMNTAAKLYGAFDLENFCESIKGSRRIVRVYSTYSNLFLEEELFDIFRSTVAHRFQDDDDLFHIQILILDPFSYAIKQRDSERPENIAMMTAKNIINLYKWMYEPAGNFNPQSNIVSVRISNALPRHQHHQIDDEINFSFYPRDYPASQSQYIRCTDRSTLGQFAEISFISVWNDHAFTKDLKSFFLEHKSELEKLAQAES